MAVRYLRRPPRPVGRGAATPPSERKAAGCGGGESTKNVASATPVVTTQERIKLAQSLAHFCAACGDVHGAGEVCQAELRRARREVDDVIGKRGPR